MALMQRGGVSVPLGPTLPFLQLPPLEAKLRRKPRFGKAFGHLPSVHSIAAEIASTVCVGGY